MMYPLMTLNDETEIVYSDMQEDGTVKVYMERPDEKYGFCRATCWLPKYKWEDIYHFSEDEIAKFEEIIRSATHLIYRKLRDFKEVYEGNEPRASKNQAILSSKGDFTSFTAEKFLCPIEGVNI
ncbi:MAG: hypothetical protein ACOYBL_01325 [Lachnospiraceae bacterium]|jgi:hypothetical protein